MKLLINFSIFKKKHLVSTWLYHSDLVSILLKISNPSLSITWNVRTAEIGQSKYLFLGSSMLYILAMSSYFVPNKILFNSYRGLDIHLNIGYNKKIGKVVRNFLDSSRIPIRSHIPFSKQVRFGFIGRDAHQKGLKNLISAFTLIQNHDPDVEIFLDIFGVNKNPSYASTNSPNIMFHGKCKDLESVYSSLDCVCLPSLYGEGTPNVILESLYCGIYCIGSDVGDVKWLLSNGRGDVINPFSIAAISKSLLKFVDSRSHYNDSSSIISRRNFVIENFSLDKALKEYENLL
jgi:glycosyltransferase involved in cell wall biosynthesis